MARVTIVVVIINARIGKGIVTLMLIALLFHVGGEVSKSHIIRLEKTKRQLLFDVTLFAI